MRAVCLFFVAVCCVVALDQTSYYQLGHKKENVSAGKVIVLVNKGQPSLSLSSLCAFVCCFFDCLLLYVLCIEDGARGLVIDEAKQARDLLGLDSKHAASINVLCTTLSRSTHTPQEVLHCMLM